MSMSVHACMITSLRGYDYHPGNRETHVDLGYRQLLTSSASVILS